MLVFELKSAVYAIFFNFSPLVPNILICEREEIISLNIPKTGVLCLRYSCLHSTMGFLEYMKNTTKKIMLKMPNGMKRIWIVNTLISITIEIMGPYIISVKENERVISSKPKSLLKTLVSCPGGVISKNFAGDLTIPWTIF